jgi:hypothetical protein
MPPLHLVALKVPWWAVEGTISVRRRIYLSCDRRYAFDGCTGPYEKSCKSHSRSHRIAISPSPRRLMILCSIRRRAAVLPANRAQGGEQHQRSLDGEVHRLKLRDQEVPKQMSRASAA